MLCKKSCCPKWVGEHGCLLQLNAKNLKFYSRFLLNTYL
jgi:hypothetical protein